MESKFKIGQTVKAIGFTDCFGKFHQEKPGLVVSAIRLIKCTSIQPYYRVQADEANGMGYVEGAERYFEA